MTLATLDFLAGVEALRSTLREVVRMRYVEGATVRQVAACVGTSPATVVRMERRALDQLRKGFEACGYGREL